MRSRRTLRRPRHPRPRRSRSALAALLDAEGLRKQAQIQPQGVQRRLALAVTRPLVDVSRTLHLTTPRHELQVAIGREHEDEIDTGVHLTLPPPAGAAAELADAGDTRRRAQACGRTPKPVVHRGASAARLGRRRLARAGAGRRRSSASRRRAST